MINKQWNWWIKKICKNIQMPPSKYRPFTYKVQVLKKIKRNLNFKSIFWVNFLEGNDKLYLINWNILKSISKLELISLKKKESVGK